MPIIVYMLVCRGWPNKAKVVYFLPLFGLAFIAYSLLPDTVGEHYLLCQAFPPQVIGYLIWCHWLLLISTDYHHWSNNYGNTTTLLIISFACVSSSNTVTYIVSNYWLKGHHMLLSLVSSYVCIRPLANKGSQDSESEQTSKVKKMGNVNLTLVVLSVCLMDIILITT